MKRRDLVKILSASPFAVLPSFSNARGGVSAGLLQEFSDRWEVSELYNREVFNAMPEEFLDYMPVPEVMSFGKQFTHIAKSISGYASVIRKDEPTEEPEDIDKKIISKYMDETSHEFQSMMQNLGETDMYSNDHKHKNDELWGQFSIADILLLAYHHTTHHRGQAIVYLRMKGIEPPYYRF